MTLTCASFRCTPLANGQVQLDIESPTTKPEDEVLYIDHIAERMHITAQAVYRLSRRKKNPLPLQRGAGRPRCLRSVFEQWVQTPRSAEVRRLF